MDMTYGQLRQRRKNNVILVADDDRFIRTLIRSSLDDMAEVVEVKSGDEVVEKYLECAPDLVLLDIHMPGKDGKMVLREILGVDPEGHILMISGDAVPENVRITNLSGAKGFIVKPFSNDTLMKYVLRCPTFRFQDAV